MDGVEIFGGRYVEIERTRDGQVSGDGIRKGGYTRGDVSPEERTERLAPAVGLAEQVAKAIALLDGVMAPGRFNQDLAAQGYALNRLLRVWVGQLKRNAMVGAAAKGSASAFSTLNISAGIHFPLPQFVEKTTDLTPHHGATGKAAPV